MTIKFRDNKGRFCGKKNKTVFTLNLGRNYSKEITDVTYPLIKQWAFKIGANFYEITERKFPEWPETYEKLQIYQLGQEMKNDWNIFIDCDALVNPDLFDLTNMIPKDTIVHHGNDLATVRWRYDRFFQRDGRHIGSPSWFCMASDWCIELFEPLHDMTLKQVEESIFPVISELKAGLKPIRLVEDYVMSRNIAKYGLKFLSIIDIYKKYEMPVGWFLFHAYNIPYEQKVGMLKQRVKDWGIT